MDLPRFPLFLFLVWLQSALTQVEPPTNVSLHCRNLINTVEWSYGQFLPGLKFKVKISAVFSTPSPNMVWVEPPTLHADLSFLEPSEDYLVTVSAVMGENETKADNKITFSYYMDSPAFQKCFLDFPAVNVTSQEDGKAEIHFMHPWLLYHQKFSSGPKRNSRIKKSHDARFMEQLPVLKYDVEIVNQTEGHQGFTCAEKVCKGVLKVEPPHEMPCFVFKGEMKKVALESTQEYCALPSVAPHKPSDNTFVYIIVVAFMALFAFALILYMVYKKKTKPQSALPSSMTFRDRLRQMTLGADKDVVSVPQMEPKSPTPLLPTTEETDITTPTGISSTEFDFRLPIGTPAPAEDEGVCEDAEGANDEGNEGYMRGDKLEEEEEEEEEDEMPPTSSGYEKRDLVVELAPDDQAEGYRG